MFKKDVERFDWCGARSLVEEEALIEVSEWMRKEAVLK